MAKFTYKKTITMANGNKHQVEIPTKECYMKPEELEVNELKKLFAICIIDIGCENIYFNFKRKEKSKTEYGFCKLN